MGAIRKTASVSTLGLINFRSKKEKLARSERALLQEHAAREAAEHGLAAVGSELRRLSTAEQKAAKQLARLRKRSRKVRKADRLTAVLNTAQPVMQDSMNAARKHGRRARKAAKRGAHEIRVGAEKALDEARSAMAH